MKKYLIAVLLFVLFLSACIPITYTQKPFADEVQSIQPEPYACNIDNIQVGCGKVNNKFVPIYAGQLPTNKVQGMSAGQDYILLEGKMIAFDDPPPGATVIPVSTPITIYLYPDISTPTTTSLPPTITPTLLSTSTVNPTVLPRDPIYLYPTMSGARQGIGDCTIFGFGRYNLPGKYYGKLFGVTANHCVTNPMYSSKSGEAPYYAPAQSHTDARIVGVTSYGFPYDPILDAATTFYRYDAGTFITDPNQNIYVSNIIPEVGSFSRIVSYVEAWNRVGQKVRSIGVRGGDKVGVLLASDVVMAIYNEEGKQILIVKDQLLVEGQKDATSQRGIIMKPGDSGSPFWMYPHNSHLELLGMGWAGSPDYHQGLVASIEYIMSGLHIDFFLNQ